ncbi:hypothetical protein HII31_04027 [Pseudocercospora fuligena]|uniref:Bromo domain-containing protein n=1 Tax=Pseudocercospora fuligena TaxID=685502 RepID=A0A8H6RLC8_9PEZI|nr:hypothetical protein HII31_04027 [Pseudocercospora fuligena]
MSEDVITQLFPDLRGSVTDDAAQAEPNTMGAFRDDFHRPLVQNYAIQQQQGPEGTFSGLRAYEQHPRYVAQGAGNGYLNAEYLQAAQLSSDLDPFVEEYNQSYPNFQQAQQAAPFAVLPAPFATLLPPPAPAVQLHQNYQYHPRVPVPAAPPALPPIPQVPNGQQRIVTAQEREAYRQLMIRHNRPQRPQPTASQPWLKYPDTQMTIGLRESISRNRIGPLKRSQGANSFRDPLSAGIPRLMLQAMNLNKLGEKLKNGDYYSLRDFMRDFYRIIENCKATFQEGHYLREDANSIEHYWEMKMSDLRSP